MTARIYEAALEQERTSLGHAPRPVIRHRDLRVRDTPQPATNHLS